MLTFQGTCYSIDRKTTAKGQTVFIARCLETEPKPDFKDVKFWDTCPVAEGEDVSLPVSIGTYVTRQGTVIVNYNAIQ